MKHFLTLKDFSKEEILEMIDLALKVKKEAKNKIFKKYLENKTLGMIFEKSSTRTRVSFETGIYQLGGTGLFLSSNDLQLGRGEPVKDTSMVLSRMLDMLMIRTFEQEKLEEFAKYSEIPIINGLTDKYHPVQLLADYMTIIEHNKVENLIVSYIGDINNMSNSWMMLASKIGFELRIASPVGYDIDKDILKDTLNFSKISGAKIIISNNPREAILGSTVVTTDTWISMGQEGDKQKKMKDFAGFTIDSDLFRLADKNAIFLHCLPAYRGYEVSSDIIDGEQSVVYDEAENRLHAQKGLMIWLDKINF